MEIPLMIEREMEDLIAAYPKEFFPRKDMVLKGRQGCLSGVGRYDLWFEDEHGTNVLMEIKARPAKYQDADQCAKYKDALDQNGERYVLMWLVATIIPGSVRSFLDNSGIEYTEIHEAEYRVVAQRHNYTFESESTVPNSSCNDITRQVKPTSVPSNTPSQERWVFRGTEKEDVNNEVEFLSRCGPGVKQFFSTFFEYQKTLGTKTQITWQHESGFSMHFRFPKLGFVEMIWGFPAENRKGARSRTPDSLVLPLDFALKRGVPEDFLNRLCQTLMERVPLSGGQKRPSIRVSSLSQEEVTHILSTISSYVEKAWLP